mmetsp:Transcript_14997/g.20992  ORF Transcript_14997/g.20992 Transcript_14997/m.20992 type:complete len:90 (-) Transcript_14997:51-320(-)
MCSHNQMHNCAHPRYFQNFRPDGTTIVCLQMGHLSDLSLNLDTCAQFKLLKANYTGRVVTNFSRSNCSLLIIFRNDISLYLESTQARNL